MGAQGPRSVHLEFSKPQKPQKTIFSVKQKERNAKSAYFVFCDGGNKRNANSELEGPKRNKKLINVSSESRYGFDGSSSCKFLF